MSGGGFWGGLADGVEMGQQWTANARRQQMLDRQEEDRQRERALRDSRKADVSIAVAADNQPARAGDEGPVSETKRPIWESLDRASQARLQSGDLEGYEQLASKSVALKSLHFNTKLNQAAMTGDPTQIASVMSEMSPGYKFSANADKSGAITGSVTGPDGNTVPMTFKSRDEMIGMVDTFTKNGSVAATLREAEKSRADNLLRAAQTRQADAQTGLIQANTTSENALRSGKVEEQGARAGLIDAQTAQATASASKIAAERQSPIEQTVNGLKRLGVDEDAALAYAMGKGDKAKSREALITDVATKLVDSNAKQLGAPPLKPEDALKQAAQLVDGAAQMAGTSRVGSGAPVGAGMTPPASAARTGSGPGMGIKAPSKGAMPQLDAAEARRAAEIKAAVRSGQMSREAARQELQALGFQ
jgi:hypothetical protein